jgi:hypothetical protein
MFTGLSLVMAMMVLVISLNSLFLNTIKNSVCDILFY